MDFLKRENLKDPMFRIRSKAWVLGAVAERNSERWNSGEKLKVRAFRVLGLGLRAKALGCRAASFRALAFRALGLAIRGTTFRVGGTLLDMVAAAASGVVAVVVVALVFAVVVVVVAGSKLTLNLDPLGLGFGGLALGNKYRQKNALGSIVFDENATI